MKNLLLIMGLFGLLSCSGKQELVTVSNVDLNQYMGKWYEIARLPNSFEKNLTCISAEYSLMENGRIKVDNQGRLLKNTNEIKQSVGEAKLPDTNYPGRLKVSFFKPFWGPYYIFELDEAYTYSLVGTPSRKYFWILSRTTSLDQETMEYLLKRAKEEGFDVDNLVYPKHDCY